ncbi:PAS domain-containing protein [Desulfobacula sp.]
MAIIYDEKFWNKKKTIDDRVGDSMIAFGIGLACFFWFFNVLIRFIDSPDLGLKLLLIGTDLQFYESLFGSTLLIVFGSHVSSNIKKRRQAEENFKKTEEKYRVILENIGEGYYEISLRGKFKFINNFMCTILARDEKEIIGTNIISHLDEKYISNFNTFLNKIIHNEERSGTIKCKFKLKGGKRKDVEISAYQLLNTDLKIDGVRGIIRDISCL